MALTDASIATFTGRKVFPLDLIAADVCLEDVAHALANTARFGGHTRVLYSVAQHAVLCSHNLPAVEGVRDARTELYLLHHDDAEAYLGDMPRPIKHELLMRPFREAEERAQCACYRAFGLLWVLEPKVVKHVDAAMLALEQAQVWAPGFDRDLRAVSPLGVFEITPLPPLIAERMFLQRHAELVAEIAAQDNPPERATSADPTRPDPVGADVAR